jgi:hypothetical protein
LEYIIENYDNLSDYTVFIHGHRTSYHNHGFIDDQINDMIFENDYKNINNAAICSLTTFHDIFQKTKLVLPELRNIIGDINLHDLKFKGCAQFFVGRDAIHR